MREHKRKITFQNATGTENLVNFPVLVELNPSRINYGVMLFGSKGLRFLDSDGALLDHDVESWNPDGTSIVWVRIPQIDLGSDSDFFWMVYGNPYQVDLANHTGVWQASYVGTYHLGTDLTSSTGTNDGTDSGTSSVSGRFGQARSFDGTSSSMTVTTSGLSHTTGTVEAWAYSNNVAAPSAGSARYVFSYVVNNNPGTNTRIYLQLRNGTDPNDYQIGIGNRFVAPSGDTLENLTLGQWHYIALTWNSGTARAYLNGSVVSAGSLAYATAGFTGNAVFSPAAIGRFAGGGELWNGSIDETRVSSTARSDEWIRVQYRSMADSLLSYGPEQFF